MAYTKPKTLTPGSVLTSADITDNQKALRLYLHEEILTSDFEASDWIQTRHIQPPVYDPYTGDQHGVSGHIAGQAAEGVGVRLTFCTSFLTGGGRAGALPEWVRIPNTSFTLDMRRGYRGLFHYWIELEHGPDNVPFVTGENYDVKDRLCYVAPYVGNPSLVDTTAAQEGQNHQGDPAGLWLTAPPYGARLPYTIGAGYGARDGCVAFESSGTGRVTVGLAHYSQIDRVAVVNWGVSLEAWYI